MIHNSEPQISVPIRWLMRIDMPRVLAIESSCFEQVWTPKVFQSYLTDRRCIGMVAYDRNKILGFMLYLLQPGRLELLRLAVDPKYRALSVGSQMLEKLKGKLSQGRRESITIKLRESNLDAQLFFRAHEFKAINVERGHFEDTQEDAYEMVYSINAE